MARTSNTGERRAQIVAGLLAVIAQHGYDKASIQLIAERARLAPGLVHYHFKNKEAILLALVDSLAEVARSRYAGLLAAGTTPDARLRAFLQARLGLGPGAQPAAVAAWVMIGAEAVRQPQVRAAYQAALAEELTLLRGLIDACLAARGKAGAGAAALAASLLAFAEGAFQLASATEGLLPQGFAADSAMQIALRWMDGEPLLEGGVS
jgi:TetR/AcrR family transcriptional repressor of bet genes